jgi:DNA-binding transcriptional regulator YbjK
VRCSGLEQDVEGVCADGAGTETEQGAAAQVGHAGHHAMAFWQKWQWSTTFLAPWLLVTAAVTPKGERRRYALVSAAAELLAEGGFEAVRHRAVARRAGLPLASTTYYFSSLDDLIARAVEHIGMIEVAQLRSRVNDLSRRRRGPETTAEVLVDLLVGDVSGPGLAEQLISRYERHIASTRLPALRETMRRNLRQRAEAVAEAVEKSGRSVHIELVCTLICAVDGSVVAALVEGRDPRTAVIATVVDLIDVLAPIDERPVRL